MLAVGSIQMMPSRSQGKCFCEQARLNLRRRTADSKAARAMAGFAAVSSATRVPTYDVLQRAQRARAAVRAGVRSIPEAIRAELASWPLT